MIVDGVGSRRSGAGCWWLLVSVPAGALSRTGMTPGGARKKRRPFRAGENYHIRRRLSIRQIPLLRPFALATNCPRHSAPNPQYGTTNPPFRARSAASTPTYAPPSAAGKRGLCRPQNHFTPDAEPPFAGCRAPFRRPQSRLSSQCDCPQPPAPPLHQAPLPGTSPQFGTIIRRRPVCRQCLNPPYRNAPGNALCAARLAGNTSIPRTGTPPATPLRRPPPLPPLPPPGRIAANPP